MTIKVGFWGNKSVCVKSLLRKRYEEKMKNDMPMNIWATPQTPEDKGCLWQNTDFWGGTQYTNTEKLIKKLEGMKVEETISDHNQTLDDVIKLLKER